MKENLDSCSKEIENLGFNDISYACEYIYTVHHKQEPVYNIRSEMGPRLGDSFCKHLRCRNKKNKEASKPVA